MLDDALSHLTQQATVAHVFDALEDEPPRMPLYELTPELIDAATIEERDAIINDLEQWGLLRLPHEAIAIKFPMEKIAELFDWKPLPYKDARNFYLTMMFAGEPLTIKDVTLTKANARSLTEDELKAQLATGESWLRRVVAPVRVNRYVLSENVKRGSAHIEDTKKDDNARHAEKDIHAMGFEALTVLLASLAARNVVKDVRYNGREMTGDKKPFYQGRGGMTYLHLTVVRPPKIEDAEMDPDHPPRAGLAKMLLVRGHIRNQVADTTVPQPPNTRITVVGKGREGRREQWIAPFYRGVDPEYVPQRHYVVKP